LGLGSPRGRLIADGASGQSDRRCPIPRRKRDMSRIPRRGGRTPVTAVRGQCPGPLDERGGSGEPRIFRGHIGFFEHFDAQFSDAGGAVA
jgi:hypothetical protein